MENDNIKTVEAYLESLKNHDLSAAPIADDICFENPISGADCGSDHLRSFLAGFILAIRDVRVLRHVSKDDHVATHWEVDSDFGTVRVLEMFEIRDGKIVDTVAYFDPRPILGSK